MPTSPIAAGPSAPGAAPDRPNPLDLARPAVVFDYDGTLADTAPAIVRTAHQVLAEYGMSDEEMGDLRRLIGPPFPLGYTLVFGIPPADAAALTERYRVLFAQLAPDAYPLFDGMADLLRALKAQGRRLAVASSKKDALVREMLAEQGVLDLFDVVRGSGDNPTEDKTALVEYCLHAMGVAPADAVMVGDRRYDVEAATRAGLPCIGVLYGGTGTPEELEQAGAAATADDVGGLARLLRG